MSETHQASIRRILVAIDSSPYELAALEAAARLATELRAELHGVFIEDIDLFRLAGLPFASEIDYSSGTLRPLDTEAIEQALRTRAEGVRRAIEETAQRTRLSWSFRISRGNVVQTMLTESLEADLLVVGQEKASPTASPSKASRGPIMVVVDECSGSGGQAFDAAQRLARRSADTMVALIVNDSVQNLDRSGLVAPCYVQRCSSDLAALVQAVRQWQPQLLLVDRASPLVSASTIKPLLAQLSCPLAVVQ
jgi:nucleotide-binding universal stress UspA family protein